jgi:hypothetical protein
MKSEVRMLGEEEDEALAYRASGTENTALLGRKLRSHDGYGIRRGEVKVRDLLRGRPSQSRDTM